MKPTIIKDIWNTAVIERLFDSSGMGFVVVGVDQRIADANQTFCNMLGYSLDELRGMHVYDYTHPDDMRMTHTMFAKARESNLTQAFEKRYVTKNGGMLWCKLRSEPVVDESGATIFRFVMVEDITQAKRDEINLEQMAAITEASDDAIFRSNTEGFIEFWGKGAERMYGYSAEEAIGRHAGFIADVSRTNDLSHARKLLHRGDVVIDPDALGRRKDGSLIDISVLVFPIKNREGNTVAYAAVHRDISAFKLLAQEFAPGSRHHQHLDLIERSAERATRLTRQLLALSRKQKLMPTIINPNELIRNSIALLQRSLGDDVRLETTLESAWCIREDATQLEQVLLNLTVNARHAMPTGGRLSITTSNVEITEPLRNEAGERFCYTPTHLQPGPYVRLQVSDSGCGMDQETLEKIFDPFFTTRPQGEGTGLGLSVVYGMVTQAGGSISVTSAPGQGTVFDIYLPRVEGEAQQTVPASAPSRARHHGRILVVEDDEGVRTLTAALLEHAGYTVFQAGNPREVLDGKVCSEVDLILSDVVMPDLSGPDFAELWLQRHPDARFMFMSGYFDEETFSSRLRGKVLIQKPFRPKMLIETVASEIARPRG